MNRGKGDLKTTGVAVGTEGLEKNFIFFMYDLYIYRFTELL